MHHAPTSARQPLTLVTGRAAIAMAAVRSGGRESPGMVFADSDIRPPTDVMAITSLPGFAVTQREIGDRIGCCSSCSGRVGTASRLALPIADRLTRLSSCASPNASR